MLGFFALVTERRIVLEKKRLMRNNRILWEIPQCKSPLLRNVVATILFTLKLSFLFTVVNRSPRMAKGRVFSTLTRPPAIRSASRYQLEEAFHGQDDPGVRGPVGPEHGGVAGDHSQQGAHLSPGHRLH